MTSHTCVCLILTLTYLGAAPHNTVTLRRQCDGTSVDYLVSVQKPHVNRHISFHVSLSLAAVTHHKPKLVPVRKDTGHRRRAVLLHVVY